MQIHLSIDFLLFRLFLTIVTINRNDFAIRLVLVIFAIKKRNRIMTVVIILSLFSRLFSSRSEQSAFCRTLFLGFKRLLFRLLQSLRSIEKANCSYGFPVAQSKSPFVAPYFSSRRRRKPFKITKIVLPSCPITARGIVKLCIKFKAINDKMTATLKIIFCLMILFIF